MLRLTRRSEYGIIAIAHLATRAGQAVSAREIAEKFGIPKRLLAEVMKDLTHRGLVRSTRGASGGYRLALDPERTSVRRVLQALEGPFEMVQCTGDSALENLCELLSCCPIRGPLQKIHDRITGVLDEVSIADLVRPADSPRAEARRHASSELRAPLDASVSTTAPR